MGNGFQSLMCLIVFIMLILGIILGLHEQDKHCARIYRCVENSYCRLTADELAFAAKNCPF